MSRRVPRGDVGPGEEPLAYDGPALPRTSATRASATRTSVTRTSAIKMSATRMQRYQDQRRQDQRYEVRRPGPGDPAYGLPPLRKTRFRRTRRLFRRRSVRVVSAVVAVFLVWVTFSVGQAAFKNNGQGVSANVAEWARDHYLGPVVTFGEWLSYKPPPKGGKPSFSLRRAERRGGHPGQDRAGKSKAFVPDIPATLKSLAGVADRRRGPVARGGEGQGRAGDPRPRSCATPRTRPRSTASPRSTSGWSSSPCAPARKTPAPPTGACPTTSRPASARACSPRSTAGSSSTRRAAAST